MDILDVKKLQLAQIPENCSIQEQSTQQPNGYRQYNLQNNNYSQQIGYLPPDIRNLSSIHELDKFSKSGINHNVSNGSVQKIEDVTLYQEEKVIASRDARKFIKNLYTVLMVHFIILFKIVSIFAICPPIIVWAEKNCTLGPIASCILLVVLFVLLFNQNLCRKRTYSCIFLIMFTLAESLILGHISAKFDTLVILIAIGLTIGVCLALMLFAIQKKWYCTMYRSTLLTVFVLLIQIVIIKMLLDFTILELVLSSIIALIFSFYFLIYDIQLMIYGEHEYTINSQEYIFAALIFCTDIINIPVHLSRLMGGQAILIYGTV